MRPSMFALSLVALVAALPVAAQGTGALAGKVTDQTGTGLPGANVIIVGTTIGAAADLDGNYRIVGVPVGTYDATASFAGYEPETWERVEVRSGQTRTLDFQLGEAVEQLEEVTVEFTRPIIENDAVGAPRVVSGDEIRGTPALSPSGRRQEQQAQLQGSQAPVVFSAPFDLHVRGGREQEVAYHVDGVRVAGQDWNRPPVDREGYAPVVEVGFRRAAEAPLSTFAIDVDAASYANVRRMLQGGYLPPPDAVRVEEFVNYFDYAYAAPEAEGRHPFGVHTEVARCPWNDAHRLVRVALQGRRVETDDLPPSNLVFLLDVSGSMEPENKLPLVRRAFRLLVGQLRPQDRVAIVVYAGAAGLVLEPTSGADKAAILAAIDRLEAGGSTAGGEGLRLAYATARRHFDGGANNRVILATDGDFNVGASSDAEMMRLVEEERASGVFLSVLGVGEGNLQDAKMELLADRGNGNYAYLDSIREAHRMFVQELGGTLFTLAKDVKVQVEFNPARVAGYRLIGYENRALRDEEFNDDTRDAGELGAGHSVTALYEVVPAGADTPIPGADSLRYQTTRPSAASATDELLTVRLRYKPATGAGTFADESVLLDRAVRDGDGAFDGASEAFRFATAVAEFALLLRRSAYAPGASYDHVLATARRARGQDESGYRAEFVGLVEMAQALAGEQAALEAQANEEGGGAGR